MEAAGGQEDEQGRLAQSGEHRPQYHSTGLNNSYTYDADGLRLSKTVGSVEHKYVWQGGKLVSEYFGGKELEFFYDESGTPYAFSYKSSAGAAPAMYYYVTNLQGDVVNILNASGGIVATYSYNAWGKVLTATGTMAGVNPLRYCVYYYDTDTGLYYLKSRYYDPEICRFINADNLASTGQGTLGTNMFAYCLNNPIPTKDTQGNLAAWIVGGLVGGLIGGAVSALEGNGFAAGFIQGATSGAIAGAGVDFAIAVVATGGLAGVAVGAGIAFVSGYAGEIAGQQTCSVATGNGFKKMTSSMWLSAARAGMINTVSFGLGALFQYADDGFRAMRESAKRYGIFKTAFSKSFSPGISDAYAKLNLFADLSMLYSKPVASDDDILDYIPTQFVAEYAKRLGYDGIAFRSSLTPELEDQDIHEHTNLDRYNIVVFNYHKCEPTGSNIVNVTRNYLECEQIDQDPNRVDIHTTILDMFY